LQASTSTPGDSRDPGQVSNAFKDHDLIPSSLDVTDNLIIFNSLYFNKIVFNC